VHKDGHKTPSISKIIIILNFVITSDANYISAIFSVQLGSSLITEHHTLAPDFLTQSENRIQTPFSMLPYGDKLPCGSSCELEILDQFHIHGFSGKWSIILV